MSSCYEVGIWRGSHACKAAAALQCNSWLSCKPTMLVPVFDMNIQLFWSLIGLETNPKLGLVICLQL